MSREKSSLLATMKGRLSGKKRVSNGLVSLSSAVILAVYAAGYEQTKLAADRFTAQSEERRIIDPVAVSAALPAATQTSNGADVTSADAAANGERPAATMSATAPPPAAATPAPVAVAMTSAPGLTEAAALPVKVAEGPATAPGDPRTPEIATLVAAAAPAAPAAQPSEYKDGSYFGWGTSRHGNIEANVVIQDGRIASAAISQCRTRYPCSWIAQLPGQVVVRQSPNVDYVSGATQSVNAYYYAVVEAISKAK